MRLLVFISVFSVAIGLMAAKPAKPRRPAAATAGLEDGAGGIKRVLTVEQRKQLRDFMQEQGPQYRKAMQELAQLRHDLQESALNGKADEKLIQEKTDAIGKLEAEQLRVRTLALAKITATLPAEQREKIKEVSERVRAERPKSGAGLRGAKAPGNREPAAPPPPEK